MGQTSSQADSPVVPVGALQAHLDVLKRVAHLTYEEFCQSVLELNQITKTFTDHRGKQLQFLVKKGSDSTVLWKATVRVRCMKVNTHTNKFESSRLLSLRQFIVMYREIAEQVDNLSAVKPLLGSTPIDITASKIFDEVASSNLGVADENECCICMDRKSEIILSCNHEFCETCIDSWNVAHNTCPLCRCKVESTDDTWVLAEKPQSSDYESEVKGYLVGLADRMHEPRH
ncbi:RING finger protein 141-like [Haliotis rubra]|uniref:RING finger protein 141-like n=1 Tax=Haliotis rubra TaxID=36100 RepID=UPI001EE57F33|nr:RING finger protein 141-like [Haliotis rubra]XP_046546054.1 RING finger protein 141-like [Haliotis rubra]